ncbi:hypothetical protein HJB79_05650 [Rhizobium lentis]|uniref:hypothetical protein n=1 Tax=Rhizobium TaxID=379 RepID=UPI00160DDFC7|nr:MULTISPECIES: hypothetical protein [Rhizobium]MBB3352484.1 N-methylhydantoinase B/oxoprolinase/acetone carboxylase alpha subunit [Rhizobium sp. BK049]MBX5134681.1 hypothetical protein [Rhizobium lentis]MBX5138290.1 hypothetical protein [Rhizobium lentis]
MLLDRSGRKAAAINFSLPARAPFTRPRFSNLLRCDQALPAAGDAVIITTPTGGGYGKP